ncbi:transposase [Streptomyces violaceusniger]
MVVGIETDRGSWVQALIASGYRVYAIKPRQVARFKERYASSGAKSDKGEAHALADMVRIDRDQLRPVSGDSEQAQAVKVVARAHQTLIWERTRTFQRLRNTLREYFPAALTAYADLTLTSTDALELLIKAPTPAAGARLTRTQITAVPARARRQHRDAKAATIQTALRERQLGLPEPVTAAYATTATAHARLLLALNEQIAGMEEQVKAHFLAHPDAEIYLSMPGIAEITGARVPAEFGDDPTRYASAKARKNYAGTSPITRALRQESHRPGASQRCAATPGRWWTAARPASSRSPILLSLERVADTLPQSRRPAVHERDRLQRDSPLAESLNATFKRETLKGRKAWPSEREVRLGPMPSASRPGRVPLAAPLEHPAPPLPPRTPQSNRLRDSVPNNTNYADASRITRAQDSGSRPGLEGRDHARPRINQRHLRKERDLHPHRPSARGLTPSSRPVSPAGISLVRHLQYPCCAPEAGPEEDHTGAEDDGPPADWEDGEEAPCPPPGNMLYSAVPSDGTAPTPPCDGALYVAVGGGHRTTSTLVS